MSFFFRVCLSVLSVFSSHGHGSGQEYHVDLSGDSRIRFVSDAPLEDFEGVTRRIDGFVFLAGDGLAGTTDLSLSEFYFEVDLASLDTGIGLRNRHMRENYLETGRFPFASFSGRLSELEEQGAGRFQAKAVGEFTIHGVPRAREIVCLVQSIQSTASSAAGNPRLTVDCAFPVSLSDHDIPIPRLMFMKVNEIVEVDIEFLLVPVGKGGAKE